MSDPMNSADFQRYTEQIDRMVQRVQELPDPAARGVALELLQSVMDLHGAAMSRIVELTSTSESGRVAFAKLSADPLICGILVLYGVHPAPMGERVLAAIEKLRPQLYKRGANVTLLGVEDGVVRLKVDGVVHGCGTSPTDIESTIEQTILESAPDVVEIVVEGLASTPAAFVPINMIQPAVPEEKSYEKSTA